MKREKVFSSFIWRFLERCSAQAVSFIVSVILARLLNPGIYGTVALVTVFTTILQVFVDGGFGNALIQKVDADDLDFSSVFYFNLLVCVLLYGLIFCMAPLVAAFYGIRELTAIVRVQSLIIVISGIKNIQQAYVSRNMLFKKFFFSTFFGTVCSAIVGISLAFCGFGVWALVIQNLVNNFVDTLILWFTVKWRPKLVFSLERLKLLFNYGWKLLASSLIDTVYTQIRQLVIGKFYSSSDLAYYNKGESFPAVFTSIVNASLDSVLLPSMSVEQNNKTNLCGMTRRAIKISTYVITPMMVGLAVCADNVVRLLLTEKWIKSVTFIVIFCIIYAIYPVSTANLNAVKAIGRSDVILKMEIIKKFIGVALLIATIRSGPVFMAYGFLAGCIISYLINAWPNKKLLGYSFSKQIMDIFPTLLLNFIMGIGVWLAGKIKIATLGVLVLQVLCGIIIYLIGSVVFRNENFYYLLNVLKDLMTAKKEQV